jgi:hypothetical protein
MTENLRYIDLDKYPVVVMHHFFIDRIIRINSIKLLLEEIPKKKSLEEEAYVAFQ